MTAEWDLAFTAFAWVPLHARRVVEREGFTAFDDRERRLELFLGIYGWSGSVVDFVRTLQERVAASAHAIQRTSRAGDPVYRKMIDGGVDANLRTAVSELDDFRAQLSTRSDARRGLHPPSSLPPAR